MFWNKVTDSFFLKIGDDANRLEAVLLGDVLVWCCLIYQPQTIHVVWDNWNNWRLKCLRVFHVKGVYIFRGCLTTQNPFLFRVFYLDDIEWLTEKSSEWTAFFAAQQNVKLVVTTWLYYFIQFVL